MTPAPTVQEIRETMGPVVEREGGGPPGWEETMALFLGFLLERNASVNLVSRRTAQDVLIRQALPSLAVLSLVPPGKALRVLDVGSGGGFPGIPLRILRPEIRVDLVDATRNKCRFLEECVERLGWTDAGVHWCRIEAPRRELVARRPFDLAVARALGQEELLTRTIVRLMAVRGATWIFVPPGQGDVDWRGSGGEPLTALRRLPPPSGVGPSS